MGYCVKDDIETLLQLTFDESSVPTQAKVESLIDQISAELTLRMRLSKITAIPTNETVLALLKLYSSWRRSGCCGMRRII